MSDSGYVRGCDDDKHMFDREGICRYCGYWSPEWPIVTEDVTITPASLGTFSLGQDFVTNITSDPTPDTFVCVGNPEPDPELQFNGLTPAEHERLAIMAEECAEVIQVIGKILRHGYTNAYHDNRPDLETELGQVIYTYTMMVKRGDLDEDRVIDAAVAKSRSIGEYLHHNEAVKFHDEAD